MPTIAERIEVRRLAGNPGVDRVSDATIDEQITTSDSIVKLYTLKEDWDTTNLEWPALKQASELIASSYIRQMFKEKDQSELQYKEAMSLLQLINRRSTLAGHRNVVIRQRKYKVPGLNHSESLYYSSIHKRNIKVHSSSDTSGIGEGVADLEPWR